MEIGIIGCGAITESFYLPEIQWNQNKVKSLHLVDIDSERMKLLKMNWSKIKSINGDLMDILPNIDGLVVATPPKYHYQSLIQAIRAGVPVLCEKPITETYDQLKHICKISKEKNATILVNNTRRLFPSMIKVKDLLRKESIGTVRSISYVEGSEFTWPSVSGFYFEAENPKGVLFDRGPHVLDLVNWWTDERLDVDSYYDDSRGGPEAECSMVLKSKNTTCKVSLSWVSKLSNEYMIKGDSGCISGNVYSWRNLTITKGNRVNKIKCKSEVKLFKDLSSVLMKNFISSIHDKQSVIVTPEDVLGSIKLIEDCYGIRKTYDFVWDNYLRTSII